MLKRRILGGILFVLSFGLFLLTSSSFLITGNVIFDSENLSLSFYYLVLMVIFIASLFLINIKVSLDALLIPCSNNIGLTKKRAKEAAKQSEKYPNAVIVASGGKTPRLDPKFDSEAQIAYEFLTKAGVSPSQISLENKAEDTFDNIRYSLEKLKDKNVKKIGVVSNSIQLNRIEKIVAAGKKEGKIPNDLDFIRIDLKPSAKEFIYENLSSVLTNYKLRKSGYEGNLPHGGFRRVVNYFLNLGGKK